MTESLQSSPVAPGADFWRAALDFYARPGAQRALLRLQDEHGGDVMRCLWLLAAARAGRRLGPADLGAFDSATAAPRAEAFRLRIERRRLQGGDPAAYEAAKAAELAAERQTAAAAPDPAAAGAAARSEAAALAKAHLALMQAALDPPLSPAALGELAALAVAPAAAC